MICFVVLQISGGAELHLAAVRPADGDGREDCAGGVERPREYPAARRAGQQDLWLQQPIRCHD